MSSSLSEKTVAPTCCYGQEMELHSARDAYVMKCPIPEAHWYCTKCGKGLPGQCDRCDKTGVPVKRTRDGDGPFCRSCFNAMVALMA